LGADLPSAASGNTVWEYFRAAVLLRAWPQWGVRILGRPLLDAYLVEALGGADIFILLLTVSKELLRTASWYFREESAARVPGLLVLSLDPAWPRACLLRCLTLATNGRHHSRDVALAGFLSAAHVLRGRQDPPAEGEGLAGYTWVATSRRPFSWRLEFVSAGKA
jgi:hypothetical protein